MSESLTTLYEITLTAPFWWSALLLAVLVLAYLNVSRWVWLAVLGVMLLVFSAYASAAPVWTRVIAWPVLLLPWAVLSLPLIRRRLISHGVLEHLRARVPELTRAELLTLRSGHTWWESAFFAGKPGWRTLLATETAQLSDSERRFLKQNVPALCDAIDDYANNDTGIPAEVLERLGREKFFGLPVSPRYTGLGFSRAGVSAVLTRLATRHPALALTVAAAMSVPELLMRFGTDGQKDALLPELATGQQTGALALSGADTGSDLAAMSDEAVAESNNGHPRILLTFAKRHVTLATEASVFIVAARLRDPEGCLGQGPEPGLTLFVVPATAIGVQRGGRHHCIDAYFSQGPLIGTAVQLGIDDVLGGADGVGRGWQMLSDAQSAMRVLGVPAASSGAAKRITRVAGAHARIRFQHPDPIGFLPGVQQYLARMASATYGIEALRRVTLSAFAAGKEPAVVAAITKYQCAERLRLLVNDATEVLGAKALCRGPNNLLEPYLNLPALALHIDGPNLVSRNLRIYGQGLMRSHPFVVRELEAVRDDDRLRGEERFDQLFGQHIAFAVSNLVKTLMLSIGGSRLAPTPLRAGWTRRWFRRLSRMTAAFAFTNDALLAIFGGNLKDRQCESARMAEIIGQLYTATAILKFYRDQDSPNEDRPLVEFALAGSLWEIQTRFDALFENLPPLPGWLLRRLVFPFGRPYKRPSDSVASAVAGLILVPSGSRNRLTGGICLPADPQAPFNILEQAHARVVDCKPLYRKLEEACAVRLISGHNVTQWLDSACGQKVLDADEIAALTEAERIRRQALRVDDYGSD